jgi:phosphoribosylformylglycinamidine synthase
MKKFKAEIDVMPHDALLDPQGKAVNNGLQNLGLKTISNVRVGKHIVLQIEAESTTEAEKMVAEACDKLLCNKIMERYEFRVFAI